MIVILPFVMIRAVAAATLLAVALVACGSDLEPEPLPPVPSASPTPVALPVPPEATAETAQGAAAFARYYFGELVNEAYAKLNAERVGKLSTNECGSCANIVTDIDRLRAADRTVGGDRFKIAFAEASPPEADGSIVVDFRFSSDPYVEMDKSGKTVREEPAQVDQDAQAKLVRRGDGWAVDAIRTVDS